MWIQMICFGSNSEILWRDNLGMICTTIFAMFIAVIWLFRNSFRKLTKMVEKRRNTAVTVKEAPSRIGISKFVSTADLRGLINDLEGKLSEMETWDTVIEKKNNRMSYRAKCYKQKDGPLKYFSMTVFEQCPTEVLRDFYMDNEYRKKWDKTLVSHEQLQVDEINGVEIGRTIKKFVLLKPREYVLAWRLWEGEGKTYYCFIKECEHALAPRQKKFVRVEFFRSGWRIRKVPGKDACEIMMVHQEDAGLNMEMARLAFSKGIWSFMCKMDAALRLYPGHSPPVTHTLIKQLPPELQTVTPTKLDDPGKNSISLRKKGKKFVKKPSKRLIANSLLLLGGVFCLTRGDTSLVAKVAVACILKKLSRPQGAHNAALSPDLH